MASSTVGEKFIFTKLMHKNFFKNKKTRNNFFSYLQCTVQGRIFSSLVENNYTMQNEVPFCEACASVFPS